MYYVNALAARGYRPDELSMLFFLLRAYAPCTRITDLLKNTDMPAYDGRNVACLGKDGNRCTGRLAVDETSRRGWHLSYPSKFRMMRLPTSVGYAAYDGRRRLLMLPTGIRYAGRKGSGVSCDILCIGSQSRWEYGAPRTVPLSVAATHTRQLRTSSNDAADLLTQLPQKKMMKVLWHIEVIK